MHTCISFSKTYWPALLDALLPKPFTDWTTMTETGSHTPLLKDCNTVARQRHLVLAAIRHVARLLYNQKATGPMQDIMAVSDPLTDKTVIFNISGCKPFSFGRHEEQEHGSAFPHTRRAFARPGLREVNACGASSLAPEKH
jgi:hypothetical protein